MTIVLKEITVEVVENTSAPYFAIRLYDNSDKSRWLVHQPVLVSESILEKFGVYNVMKTLQAYACKKIHENSQYNIYHKDVKPPVNANGECALEFESYSHYGGQDGLTIAR